MPKTTVKQKDKEFTLPKYLMLAKGAMWLDTQGEESSGVKLYACSTKFIGRGKPPEKEKAEGERVPVDKFGNKNFVEYGFVDVPKDELSWYIDTTQVPLEKQSRLILAYKHKILVEADPKKPPVFVDIKKQAKDFEIGKKGERVFVGKNKEIFRKLQNLTMSKLREFVKSCPKTEAGKNNLIDMYHYEVRGYNNVARPRLEVLDLIRAKLKEFGPTMSAIRINED